MKKASLRAWILAGVLAGCGGSATVESSETGAVSAGGSAPAPCAGEPLAWLQPDVMQAALDMERVRASRWGAIYLDSMRQAFGPDFEAFELMRRVAMNADPGSDDTGGDMDMLMVLDVDPAVIPSEGLAESATEVAPELWVMGTGRYTGVVPRPTCGRELGDALFWIRMDLAAVGVEEALAQLRAMGMPSFSHAEITVDEDAGGAMHLVADVLVDAAAEMPPEQLRAVTAAMEAMVQARLGADVVTSLQVDEQQMRLELRTKTAEGVQRILDGIRTLSSQ